MPIDVNLLFMGGVHAVGKSTICKSLCSDLGISYLSASELIKRHNARVSRRDEDQGKKVADVKGNQDALVVELFTVTDTNTIYLLDGHFTLLNKNNEVVLVPLETFRGIRPKAIVVVTDEPEHISRRLQQRDSVGVDLGILENMQKKEVEHARAVAADLGIKCYEVVISNTGQLRTVILDEVNNLVR